MSLESLIENKKIERIKKRLSRRIKSYNRNIERLKYIRHKLEMCEELQNRIYCPYCEQKIDSDFYKKQIPSWRDKKEFLESWIDFDFYLEKRLRRPLNKIKEQEKKKWNKKVEEYRIKNRNKLNKAIRDLELPNDIINTEEKKLWNDAIEKQIDNRNITYLDEFELQFEI